MSQRAQCRFPAALVPATFREAVANARAELGWSQARLAAESGLERATILRLEAGPRVPTADTVFRLEKALDLEPGTLVPEWPEWSPIGSTSLGARSRERRRALGLSIGSVGLASGLSAATISRFEREERRTPKIVTIEITGVDSEIATLVNEEYATALGFSDCAAHARWCEGDES